MLLPYATLAQKTRDTSFFRITEINIIGNFKTEDRIVLIAADLTINQRIPKKDMKLQFETAENNVQNTDLFNTVDISNFPINDTLTELIITVSERWFFWPIPIVENADPNFNTWWQRKDFSRLNYGLVLMYNNLGGKAQGIGGLIQLGYSKRFALLYNIPYASSNGKLGVSFYGGYDQQHEVTIGTNNNKRVFYTGLGGNTKEHWQLQFSLLHRHKIVTTNTISAAFKNVSIVPPVSALKQDYLGDSLPNIRYLELSYLFKKDKRNYKHYPLTGYYLDLLIQQHGLGINNNLFLTTFEGSASKFLKVHNRVYGAIGFKGKFTPQNNIPYFLQQGLGYDNNLRGYEYYVVDGNHFGMFKSNIKLELIEKKNSLLKKIKNQKFNTFYYALYLNFFADLGYVDNQFSAQANSFSNQWLYSSGIGLDLSTYYDSVFRLEFSINKQKESGFFLHFTQPI
ncbi:MAG: hypothetical protein HON99_07775 [Crocinitomicaceae bacterium]|nr:hypothetical protein [Crocinitomicaceae bacterium]